MSNKKDSNNLLCDLIKSSLNNKIDSISREKAFSNFGKNVIKLFNSLQFDDNIILENPLLLSISELIDDLRTYDITGFVDPDFEIYDVDISSKEEDNDDHKWYRVSEEWKDGKLVSKEETVGFSVPDNLSEQYITEDDLIFSLYRSFDSSLKESLIRNLYEAGCSKQLLKRFFIEENPSFDDCEAIVNAMNSICTIDYKVLNKYLYGDKYIFTPIKDLFDIDLNS